MKRSSAGDFAIPAALVALSVIPAIGGVVRLASLSGGAPVTPENARFLASPIPVAVHAVTATVYALLGAFQFSPGLRRRSPRWHRTAGKVVGVCGLLVGLSGLWMTAFYAIPTSLQGPLVRGVRFLVGSGMVTCVAVGWASILKRKVKQHEAWMLRAYALGQGAGTQALLLLPPALVSGEVLGFTRDVVMTAAWVLNVGVAEWIIRRPAARAKLMAEAAVNRGSYG